MATDTPRRWSRTSELIERIFWRVLWWAGVPMLAGLAIVSGAQDLGPAWRAGHGHGFPGVFVAQRAEDCGDDGCTWHGQFSPADGTVRRTDVKLNLPRDARAGDRVAVIDGGGSWVYRPDASREWIPDAVILLVGTLLAAVWLVRARVYVIDVAVPTVRRWRTGAPAAPAPRPWEWAASAEPGVRGTVRELLGVFGFLRRPPGLVVRRVVNLDVVCEGRAVVAASVGPAGTGLLLTVDPADEDVAIPDEPWQQGPPATPLNAGARAVRAYQATLLVVRPDGTVTARRLGDLELADPDVQPLPDGQILVVSPRCRKLPQGAERNAVVYDRDGTPRHQVTLGDGLAEVQTSAGGAIWAAYAEEGVAGELGWGGSAGPAPIGAPGLVRFDTDGAVRWHYQPPGAARIGGCDGLNVSGDHAWACYTTEHDKVWLVCVPPAGTPRAWRLPTAGGPFAVDRQRVLLVDDEVSGHTALLNLGEGRATVVRSYQLVLPDGQPVLAARLLGRGPVLHAFTADGWYQADLCDVP